MSATDKLYSSEAPGVTESGKATVGAVREWLTSIGDLATLEIRYSIEAVTATLVACLLLGAVLFSSLTLVLASIAVAVVQAGWAWLPALLLVIALNLLLALLLWWRIHNLIERVGMDTTRRALGLVKAVEDVDTAQPHRQT